MNTLKKANIAITALTAAFLSSCTLNGGSDYECQQLPANDDGSLNYKIVNTKTGATLYDIPNAEVQDEGIYDYFKAAGKAYPVDAVRKDTLNVGIYENRCVLSTGRFRVTQYKMAK